MLDVTLAAPQRRDALTIFPLVTVDDAELPYALLADALDAGTVRITEVGSGTVPRLLATNKGEADVLILDGEQLIGARQNRMTNRSLLLPAGIETEIPVSCMEQGRWNAATDPMKPTSHHSPANVRRHARKAEAEYALMDLAAPEEALAHAQVAVWDEIADYSASLGAASGTGALNDVYGIRSGDIEEWAGAFPCGEDQVGLLAFVGDRPIGLDVIGGRALYARLHGRLLRGYIMDALAARARGDGDPTRRAAREPDEAKPDAAEPGAVAPDAAGAQRFLDRVRGVRRVASPTVGRGVYRVLAGDVIGGELEDGGRLVHLCGFPGDDGRGREPWGTEDLAERPVAPPSRRRRMR